MTARIVAVKSGGDWYDASVDILNIPADLDLDAAKQRWRAWTKDVYMPAHKVAYAAGPEALQRLAYWDFAEWLVREEGATDADVEEYWP